MQAFTKGQVNSKNSKGKKKAASSVAEALALFEKAGEESDEEVDLPLVSTGVGLPALPKKLCEKIAANEFSELPPAKGKGRSMSQAFEGQVIVVQAADLMQSRKIIPDLATWVQCFGLYSAVVASQKPERVPELMTYMAIIAKASIKYKWPSWIIYDQNFCMEVAGNPSQSWARVDPSMYAQCFTGQALSTENWCARCQCLDHSSGHCPYRPQKRPWGAAFGQSPAAEHPPHSTAACIKFNCFNGDCKFDKHCRYQHICSSCGGDHPATKCKNGAKAAE